MNQQDLVWVKLPYTSLEESKIRPAVVISNNSYHQKYDDIVVCAITSKLEETPYSIFIEQKNLSTGRLPVKSRIRADKIMQVEKSLIIRSFAKLDNKTFDYLVGKIINLIKREEKSGKAAETERKGQDREKDKNSTEHTKVSN